MGALLAIFLTVGALVLADGPARSVPQASSTTGQLNAPSTVEAASCQRAPGHCIGPVYRDLTQPYRPLPDHDAAAGIAGDDGE